MKMIKSNCLTIVMPALNEESAVAQAVNDVLSVGREVLEDFEIILVNDGSRDKTGELMNELAENNMEVQVRHNLTPCGVSQAVRHAINVSRFDKLVLIAGDGEITVKGLRDVFGAIGFDEMAICYRVNQAQARSTYRYMISKLFTIVLKLIFRINIRDFHSMCIWPVPILKKMKLRLNGNTVNVELMVKLFRKEVPYVEVPYTMAKEFNGSSQVVRPKTFFDFSKMIWYLFRDKQ